MQINSVSNIAFIDSVSFSQPLDNSDKSMEAVSVKQINQKDEKTGINNSLSSKSQKENIENIKVQQVIQQLKRIEQKVKAHEMAHKSVGGELAGSIRYKYKTGPDGKRYIVGGEVPINIRQGKTPEETIKIAQKVKAAALAPADPSPQDLRVAARASAMETQARAELAKKQLEEKDKIKDDNQNSSSDISNAEKTYSKNVEESPQISIYA